VGADGLHSAVRAVMLGPERPRYSGYTCWRGLTGEFLHPAMPVGLLHHTHGPGVRVGAGYFDACRIYWWVTASREEGERDAPEGAKPGLRPLVAGWPSAIPEMIEASDEADILRNDVYDRPPAPRWGAGRVTLLGDAAHPMTPDLGQGACSAIEDGFALGRALDGVSDLEAGLRAYERARQPPTAQMQRASRRSGVLGQWSHPAAVACRELMLRSVPTPLLLQRFGRLWAFQG